MRPRRGFTLVEVMIALVILGIVTGAIYRLLDANRRIAVAQAEQVMLQSNVRTGSLIVPNELRELNTVATAGAGAQNDILDNDADGIQYRAARGLGFVCVAAGAGATQLMVERDTWTGLRAPESPRDLYIFSEGASADDEADDSWVLVTVTAAATVANGCGAEDGYQLSVPGGVPAAPVNTPVRMYEEMELRHYSQDGQWWLGGRSVSAGGVLQPVLGPLTSTGFQLEYLDNAGNVTGNASAVTSIRVRVRGLTDDAVRQAGGFGSIGHPEEGLVTQVLLRNSIRP